MCGSCHPIQNHMWKLNDSVICEVCKQWIICKFDFLQNVKIEHLKTGSVKFRLWKQGVGCKKCLNCEVKKTFFDNCMVHVI